MESKNYFGWSIFLVFLLFLNNEALAQLITGFYDQTCPEAESIVRDQMSQMIFNDPRIAGPLLRMHFHDCFVQGCDASILLDDTATMQGEKNAGANKNSLRGYEYIDQIKVALEKQCPGVVSCADIVTIVARDCVALTGGPSYDVLLGRRDALSANFTQANTDLPAPNSTLSQLITKFANKGLSAKEMVVLSGSHTIGRVRCAVILPRIYNFQNTGKPDPAISPNLLIQLQALCPQSGDGNVSAPLDVATPIRFDNNYYRNLQANMGMLISDQVLQTAATVIPDATVSLYVDAEDSFFKDFAAAMVKMGSISPLTGAQGEIRTQCRAINTNSS